MPHPILALQSGDMLKTFLNSGIIPITVRGLVEPTSGSEASKTTE